MRPRWEAGSQAASGRSPCSPRIQRGTPCAFGLAGPLGRRTHTPCAWRVASAPAFYTVSSGPVVAMVWCGKDVVKQGRAMIGATNPLASAPGTIRGDFCIEVGRNVIHGSDSVESAQREIALWFPEGVCSYQPALNPWIYE